MSMKIALFFLFTALVVILAQKQGGLSFDVNKVNNDGTRVRVDGRQDVFNTNGGMTRGEVYGHAARTFGGKFDGEKSLGGGFRTEHNWKSGGASLDVSRRNNDGTRFRADGRQDVFKSNSGRTRGEVFGHAERTYGGRNNGFSSQGGGVRLEHSWK